MAYTLIGKDFTPPDVRAKVTGSAKYAEDFRAEGMAFCKLLLSPAPHARIRNLDVSVALEMEGVLGILQASELRAPPAPVEPALTEEPLFVGQPILAVAAENETIAADALDAIRYDLEALPFTVDPLEALYPGGPSAREDGNAAIVNYGNTGVEVRHWTAQDFAAADDGQLPTGEPNMEWSYGDVDQALADAALVLDESFVTAACPITAWNPAAPWRIGRTANAMCTAPARARAVQCRFWRACWALRRQTSYSWRNTAVADSVPRRCRSPAWSSRSIFPARSAVRS